MNRLVFKAQNMVHMHKGLYMKFSIMVAYKKNLQEYNLTSKNKTNMNKIQNKGTCKGIEP